MYYERKDRENCSMACIHFFRVDKNLTKAVTKSLFYTQLIAMNGITATVLILQHNVLDGIWCQC